MTALRDRSTRIHRAWPVKSRNSDRGPLVFRAFKWWTVSSRQGTTPSAGLTTVGTRKVLKIFSSPMVGGLVWSEEHSIVDRPQRNAWCHRVVVVFVERSPWCRPEHIDRCQIYHVAAHHGDTFVLDVLRACMHRHDTFYR